MSDELKAAAKASSPMSKLEVTDADRERTDSVVAVLGSDQRGWQYHILPEAFAAHRIAAVKAERERIAACIEQRILSVDMYRPLASFGKSLMEAIAAELRKAAP